MKHYVLGLVFNKLKNKILLVEKNRPKWQAGRCNGIGGKIKDSDDSPLKAMERESIEETDVCFKFEHCTTFICPGGTVFVFRAFSTCEMIQFIQKEDEQLKIWSLNELPPNIDPDLKWIIPVCLSTIQFPLLIQQNTLLGE